MINIYESKESNFDNNGLVILIPTLCVVSEVKNGLFELELEHRLDKEGRWEYILEDNIIKAPTPRGNQLFRICKKTKTMLGIRIYARHIFYDLINNFLEDVRPTNTNGASALNWILTHTQFPHNFTSNSDIENIYSASYIRKNPIQALIGEDENSFLSKLGGELVRDNFNIKILQSAGVNRGVTIKYRKNLLGLECDLNNDGVVTRIMPTGLRENDTILLLPEKYIDSKYINNYHSPKIQHYHFQDIKINDELTEEQAFELLRLKANELFDIHKVDIPLTNTKVSFVELSKTEEYKNFTVLETINLYDTVTIQHEKLGINFNAQVVRYKYDCLNEKYIEIELGDFKSNLSSSFTNIAKTLNHVSDTIKTNKNDLEKAIDDATTVLKSALGGYVVKRNGEILIMDTESPDTAQKVWRFNLNGLGYSNTGINGNYSVAMTMDGSIVADFITTGTLNANLIKVGALTSKDGSVSINLDDGAFKIGGNGNVAEHKNDYSKYLHQDGSYTQIGNLGLRRYTGIMEKDYHYLNYSGSLRYEAKGASIGSTATIYLPSDFKNKDFNVSIAYGNLWCGDAYAVLKYFDIWDMQIDKTIPKITFRHNAIFVSIPNYSNPTALSNAQLTSTINYSIVA